MRAEEWDEKWREGLSQRRHAETCGRANRFLVGAVEGLEPGRALDLACGAGRNAVWLAERGWRVTAVDFSQVALAEARRLAADRGVDPEWIEADVVDWEPPAAAFDLVVLLYLQVPPDERTRALGHAAHALAPGGVLLVVGHDAKNLTEGWGGPKNPDVLYTAADLAADLPGLAIVRAERVPRPIETEEGDRVALDALVLATAR
jgi:SAM-dependent methyltransferase